MAYSFGNLMHDVGRGLLAGSPGGQSILEQQGLEQVAPIFSDPNSTPQQKISALIATGSPQAIALANTIYAQQNDPAKKESAAKAALIKQLQDQMMGNAGPDGSALGAIGNTLNAVNPGMQGTLPGSQPTPPMPDVSQIGQQAAGALGSLAPNMGGDNAQVQQPMAPMQAPQQAPDFAARLNQASMLKGLTGMDLSPGLQYQIKQNEEAKAIAQKDKERQQSLEDKKNAPLSGEGAVRYAQVQQGLRGIEEIKNLAFDKNGELDRASLAQITAHIPVTLMTEPAKKIYTAAYNMANAKLRIDTGATAKEEEVQAAVRAFLPNPTDDAKTAQYKMDQLKPFFNDTLKALGKEGDVRQPSQERSSALPTSAPKYTEGQTATNPSTGRKMIYRNGQWVGM